MQSYQATLYIPGKPAHELTASQLVALDIHLVPQPEASAWATPSGLHLVASTSDVARLLRVHEVDLLAATDTAAVYGLTDATDYDAQPNPDAETAVYGLLGELSELAGPILVIKETTSQNSPRPLGGGEAVAEAPTDVVVRLTFKDPNALDKTSLTADELAAAAAWVRYDEYVTIEVLRDGTARVVPAATAPVE